MDPINPDEKIEVTPEEQNAEKEALTEVKDEELRDKLADELGLDPEEDKERLDKLVAREKSHREKLSGAIKQKIGWRDKFKATSTKAKDTPEPGKSPTKDGQETPDPEKIAERKFNELMEKRDLEDLDVPEELKDEVKKIAKLNGISVKKAAQDPYIKFKIDEIEKEKRIISATPTRKGKGSYSSSYDPSKPLNPADFDLNTEEGIKAWKDAKAARKQYEASQK